MSDTDGTTTETANGKHVTVYSKPSGCQACVNTKRWLAEREIPFVTENILEPEHLARAEELGIKAAPMVIVKSGATGSEIVFSDFRPDVLAVEFPPSVLPKTRTLTAKELDELHPVPALREAEAA